MLIRNMGFFKKTTIRFPPDLYEQLVQLAKQRDTSVGELVRTACLAQYGLSGRKARMSAVRELATLCLPVGSPEEMERESVPRPLP